MAPNSPASAEKRAQLLRELSQDLNRTRNSSASTKFSHYTESPDTTSTSFDPDNEALVSTRQMDVTPQQLPELRASAQKYSRFSRSEPRSDLDYVIDTSAIGRAFPDFTQGGSSSDDASVSIELGRGLRKGSGTISKLGKTNRSPAPATSNRDDSFDFSAPIIDNHYVMGTPPLVNQKTRKNNIAVQSPQVADSQVRRSSGLRHEIRETASPVTKTKDYVSGSSRQGSESRQTLTAMHARVRDENDVSYAVEDRPPTVDLTTRSSRFSSGKYANNDERKPLPTKFGSKQSFAPSVTPARVNTTNTKSPLAPGLLGSGRGTQSMVLPDMPNVTELVSGVFGDGTPVFSVDGKPRSSRFASTSQDPKRRPSRPDHVKVDEIEVPRDEQDIYLSLQLLQDKVEDLERIRAESELAIGELHERNRFLEAGKAEIKRSQRSDSAIGLTDGSDAGDDMASGRRKLLIEKNRLESSVRSLSSQVETAERKAAVSGITLKNVTKERDSAVLQLGIAYCTIEQLKAQNGELVEENLNLKARLGPMTNNPNNKIQDEIRKEKRSAIDNEGQLNNVFPLGKVNTNDTHRPEHSSALPNGVQEAHHDRNKDAQDVNSQLKDRLASQNAAPIAESRKPADGKLNVSARHGKKQASHRPGSRVTDLIPQVEQTRRSVKYDDSESSEGSETDQFEGHSNRNGPQQARQKEHADTQNTTRDLTYLSFLENDEIAQLRRTLEQERLERKQRQAAKDQTATAPDNTLRTEVTGQQTLPRKSSLKSTTRRATDTLDLTGHSAQSGFAPSQQITSEHARRHSETSVDARRHQQRGQSADNMTSAFILPDITMRKPIPKLSAASEKVLNDLHDHNDANCTVCLQRPTAGTNHDHTGTAKTTVTVPKPVPVSERMPQPTEFHDDPTIRPSEPPALALASVLKSLEDEIAHQKMQLAHYQKLYSGHDPALSKRQRKSVRAKIETLMQSVDMKADQIYSLYDVLEGQKQDGHEITEKEVEVTLRSIGVEVTDMALRGGDMEHPIEEGAPTERHPWDLESHDGSDGELPWEGIESTTGTTRSAQAAQGRRRSWVN